MIGVKVIEGQMDIYEVIELASGVDTTTRKGMLACLDQAIAWGKAHYQAEDAVETPYFDGEGNEGTIDEVYS